MLSKARIKMAAVLSIATAMTMPASSWAAQSGAPRISMAATGATAVGGGSATHRTFGIHHYPPVAAPNAPAGNLPGPWKPSFDSRFGNQLDGSTWATCFPWGDCNNRGATELQWNTAANVQVGDGILSLVAKRQAVDTPFGPMAYTSGLIQSHGHYDFTYGFAEMRAWLPAGRGFWPAFWLLPSDQSWPPEIDVLEAAGASPQVAELTYHWGANKQKGTDFSGPDFTAGWHTFGVDWQPHHLTWYVDGVVRQTFTNASVIPHQPMYLIANLGINGTDAPDGTTPFPAAMKISYIRVWQH